MAFLDVRLVVTVVLRSIAVIPSRGGPRYVLSFSLNMVVRLGTKDEAWLSFSRSLGLSWGCMGDKSCLRCRNCLGKFGEVVQEERCSLCGCIYNFCALILSERFPAVEGPTVLKATRELYYKTLEVVDSHQRKEDKRTGKLAINESDRKAPATEEQSPPCLSSKSKASPSGKHRKSSKDKVKDKERKHKRKDRSRSPRSPETRKRAKKSKSPSIEQGGVKVKEEPTSEEEDTKPESPGGREKKRRGAEDRESPVAETLEIGEKEAKKEQRSYKGKEPQSPKKRESLVKERGEEQARGSRETSPPPGNWGDNRASSVRLRSPSKSPPLKRREPRPRPRDPQPEPPNRYQGGRSGNQPFYRRTFFGGHRDNEWKYTNKGKKKREQQKRRRESQGEGARGSRP